MKQNIGPIAIVVVVVALCGIVFFIYKATSGSGDTVGYTAPPADKDMKAKAQKMSEEYGKNMQKQMEAKFGKRQTPGAQ